VYNLMMSYFVYALYSKTALKLYVGQTQDLTSRLKLHEDKTFKNSYTAKTADDWLLIYSEKKSTRFEALAREKQLKSFRGREFLRQHIPG